MFHCAVRIALCENRFINEKAGLLWVAKIQTVTTPHLHMVIAICMHCENNIVRNCEL